MTPAARLVASIWLAWSGPALAGPEDFPRIASTSLCGDLWALSLADRNQIVSLSKDATGPWSALADQARGLPQNRGSVEELLVAQPDLVVTSHGTPTQMRRVLDQFGITEMALEMVSDLPSLAAKAPTIGAGFGQAARGEAMAAAFTARLAELAPPAGSHRPLVIYYRPDGGGAGAGTIVDAVMTAAGYDNLQARTGPPGWGGVPLEQVVMSPPEGYVLSYFDNQQLSVRRTLGRNPVLARASAAGEALTVPGEYWLCDHPVVAEAASILAAGRPMFAEGTR
ncbi:ABC transporter substrate-binding protein [Paracoccus sp. p4-l81]|uniref:ABC transporter substrate-binding protein n=1 Tax=Paracoccus sp. p4-l81 TaxID=3342806 RepID=UPI0035BA4772